VDGDVAVDLRQEPVVVEMWVGDKNAQEGRVRLGKAGDAVAPDLMASPMDPLRLAPSHYTFTPPLT